MPAPAAPSTAPNRSAPRKVGVLLVHGMGVQPVGDTLAYMGDPLLSWGSAWLAGHGGDGRITACACADKDTAPRHVHASWSQGVVPPGAPPPRVDLIIAEGWWADEFTAPAASRIADWFPPLVWGIAWRVMLATGLVVVALALAISGISGEPPDAAFALGASLAIALCIIVTLLPSALLLVGKLPGRLADTSEAFLKFLTLWVGDVLVYERAPRDAYAARERIKSSLAWLTSKQDEAIVAAHSLGALLCIDALVEAANPKVRFFVSFGCPLRLLGKHLEHYGRRLRSFFQQPEPPGWVNFFDPLDLIGGPVDYRATFPINLKVDNGCSILGAHGGYPANLEQFQDALYRLIVFRQPLPASAPTASTAPGRPSRSLQRTVGVPHRMDSLQDRHRRHLINGRGPGGGDRAVEKAFRARWWRFFHGTSFMILSLPAAVAGAYLLYRVGWAGFIAETAQSQQFIPDVLKQVLHDAAVTGTAQQQFAGSLLVCLSDTAILAAVLLWIGHLVLYSYQSTAGDKVAAGFAGEGWTKPYRRMLAAIWLVWCLVLVAGTVAATAEHGVGGLTLVALPLLAMAIIGLVIFWARAVRHLRIHLPEGRGGRERLQAAEALGAPYFTIEHSCRVQPDGRPIAS